MGYEKDPDSHPNIENNAETPDKFHHNPSGMEKEKAQHCGTAAEEDCGYSYVGQFNSEGGREGHGKAVLSNGDIYEGQYKQGLRDGFGEYRFSQPPVCYKGYYKENKKNGFGTFTYADRSVYEGYWKDDLRHGMGTYTYANGDAYVGEWFNDSRHGKGEYTYCKDEIVYRGMWRYGKRSGEGKLLFEGNVYEGHFRNDKMLGPGKYTFKDGSEQCGEYVMQYTEKQQTQWRERKT